MTFPPGSSGSESPLKTIENELPQHLVRAKQKNQQQLPIVTQQTFSMPDSTT